MVYDQFYHRFVGVLHRNVKGCHDVLFIRYLVADIILYYIVVYPLDPCPGVPVRLGMDRATMIYIYVGFLRQSLFLDG